MVPLYTNCMSEPEYGTAELVFTVAQLMTAFISVVIFDAVIRFGLSKQEKKENVLLVGFIVLGISLIIGAVLTPIIGLYHTLDPWKWYLYVFVMCSITNSIELNYLKVKGKNKSYAFLSILQTGILASLNVWFLVYRSMGIQGYLLAYIIATFVVDVVACLMGRVIPDLLTARFDKRLFKEMITYSTPLILNNVSWWVIHSSDKLMVEIMISTAALGVYTVSAKIPSLINVMVSVFQQAWGISTVKEIESTNDTSFYSRVFKYLFLFTSGCCIGLVAIMKLFIHCYVGNEFVGAWKYIPLLLVSAVFAAVASYYGALYGALKKSVNNMITTLIAAMSNLLVNWLLIPVIGIWGAVIGTLVSYIVVAVLRMVDVNRYLPIRIEIVKYILNVSLIITQAVLVSIDWHSYLVSGIVMVAFVFVNSRDIAELFQIRKVISNEKS